MAKRTERKPWILWVGLPALLLYAALEVYDQRPILAQDRPAPVVKVAQGREPFALVELFTSEGCSSCPPAERLLNEISRGGRKQKQRVFTLAYHVDYWDHLGWKDPFASPRFTRRQKTYARALELRSLYTPQMIVNGRTEFVGSRRRSARAAIEQGLKRPAAVGLSLKATAGAGPDTLTVSWRLDTRAAGHDLRVVLAESGLATRVLRGENSGKLLPHHDVVRVLTGARLAKATQGTLQVAVPKAVKRSKACLVGFVQHPATRRVLGAVRINLPTVTHPASKPVKTGKQAEKAASR